MQSEKLVRIGGASGFWGDSATAAPQLIHHGAVDYLVFDYLAELTMSIMARMRARDPEAGYAVDFVTVVMRRHLREIIERGIKVVANAGGVNPAACAKAIGKIADELGLDVTIAVVAGDDLMDRHGALQAAGTREMFSGAAMPDAVLSMNAYLGAVPIRDALDQGAQIVITGRCVDSAVALGPLMHEFGWAIDDYDRLAAGSLVGHMLECGAQATGGLFTDWRSVPAWDRIGYPIASCRADGAFTVTKPDDTGGLVSPATLAEQMMYEIGDPQRYLLPDVVADFANVTMTELGADRVQVTGARGYQPTGTYKVSATYQDGFRAIMVLTIGGIDAAAKAKRTAEAILKRTRRMFAERNLADYTATNIEILGAEHTYGPHARAGGAREVIMRLAVSHDQSEALEIAVREATSPGTSMAPGTTGFLGGRARPSPVVRMFSFLIAKSAVSVEVVRDGSATSVEIPTDGGFDTAAVPVAAVEGTPPDGPTVMLPLIAIAHGRSGDKGDSSNIAIIAREPAYLPLIRAELTSAAVAAYMAHLLAPDSTVERFDIPGIHGVNFVLHKALGGGGMASLRNDSLGKAHAQMLLDLPIPVPLAWGLAPAA